MEQFDLIVIGAGPGGYTAALEAAALGKRVALCEKDEVGGTCLNRGCIPTKALLRAAHVYKAAAEGAAVGVRAEGLRCEFTSLFQYVEETTARLREGIGQLLARGGVTLLRGTAKLEAGRVVRVDGQRYAAEHVLLAAGSRPASPPIPGSDLPGVVTSDDLLAGRGADCGSLVILGGGVIGAEFAEIYTALGRRVTVLEMAPRLLPTLDREIGQNLAMILKKRGAEIVTGASVKEIAPAEGGLCCRYEVKGEERFSKGERVLICTGRAPCTAGLLGEGVDLGLERGYVPVDECFQTRAAGVWAVGDLVLGGVQLAHVAEAQAKNAVRAMFGAGGAKELSALPACVFTDPEIACVGLTADGAKAAGRAVTVKKSLTSANGRAVLEGAERGFAKLVFDAQDGRLLGAQLMCPHAGEMIGGLTAAVNAGLTAEQLRGTVWPHPTVSEILGAF
ncbi:dihydrolipoyl dehydrogenase [Anaerofilum sp. BX8]|uniref:Dihydrolipoyl dehydrogenase n=1 Tax=Anaerofilum hominis TaxID=2763016 RepID=A0A923I6Z6_9FIRM|nr:dihydrolipoyl dehydrogenase [Anaerofilum hominis]MBC5580107.1 dihydrolipoyl dehydrogenase [Anaerofilum hominis]